jgi:diaminopimelate decarboxylase
MQKLKYERPYIKKLNAGMASKFAATGNATAQAFDAIEGVPVKVLIEKYGSPLFVLSEKRIRHNYRAALRAFNTRYPKVQFAWSYKTNYLGTVCQLFHEEGSWAEVVSGFEYQKALKNGVNGSNIIFNGPGKKREELLTAISDNALIHIDHFDELYLLLELATASATKPRVAVRVNMDTGLYPQWDRFGFNYENGEAWNAINKIIQNGKMLLVGLHCHIGTYVLDVSAYQKATIKMCELAMRCTKELNNPVQYLDMGGGFPSANVLKGAHLQIVDAIPSIDDFAEAITTTILNFGFEQDELPLLILESGRALIDDAGYLLGTVIANKRMANGKRGTVLDFGVNTLFTSFWYDHPVTPAQGNSTHTEPMALYGPLCMNIDVVRENINLPVLDPGDHVVVHKVGAYNMTQWMQFITYRPAIAMITEQGDTQLLRKAETLAYVDEMEQTPVLNNTKPLEK